jgi:hypothetical protein
MADVITLIPRDEDGERIADAFAEQTGLEAEEADGRRIFTVDGTEHEIEVVQTLDGIDEDWTQHVALGDPA